MKPYYVDDSVTLYHGDWCESIADDFTADLILTDPPYGETSLAWDRWPDGWPALAARHANAMWCWGSMRMFLDRRDEFTDWTFSQDLVWEKHNGSNLAADRFSRVHETATFWYQGPWSEIHHETPTTADATPRTVRKKARPAQWIGATGPNVYVSQDGGPRLMRSVLYAPSMHGNAINETEKPTSFLEHLITYGCPPGGTVVDFFAGSASTGEACKLTGRKAVLFEKREQQCYEAAKRLARMPIDFGASA
jgi:site-specific DNA-methyltransferase (adenine-specific)